MALAASHKATVLLTGAATVFPSGESARGLNPREPGCGTAPSDFPVAASQSRIRSCLPEAMILPSADRAIAPKPASSSAGFSSRSILPVAASQR